MIVLSCHRAIHAVSLFLTWPGRSRSSHFLREKQFLTNMSANRHAAVKITGLGTVIP